MPIQKASRISGTERGPFAPVQVGQMLVGGIRDVAEHHALVEPQQDKPRLEPRRSRPRRPIASALRTRPQNRELADEAIQQRHAQRTERHDQINRRKIRHRRRKPAEFRNQPRVPPLVEHADDQEERPGGDSVIDLLDDAAGKARAA